jgi:hypothetical protein
MGSDGAHPIRSKPDARYEGLQGHLGEARSEPCSNVIRTIF